MVQISLTSQHGGSFYMIKLFTTMWSAVMYATDKGRSSVSEAFPSFPNSFRYSPSEVNTWTLLLPQSAIAMFPVLLTDSPWTLKLSFSSPLWAKWRDGLKLMWSHVNIPRTTSQRLFIHFDHHVILSVTLWQISHVKCPIVVIFNLHLNFFSCGCLDMNSDLVTFGVTPLSFSIFGDDCKLSFVSTLCFF